MQEGTSTPETLIDKLEMYKKSQDNIIDDLKKMKQIMEEIKKAQDNLIDSLKKMKKIMLELTELDEED